MGTTTPVMKASIEEELEEASAENLDLREYFALASRRYWYLILGFFIGWALVFAVSWVLPTVYRSGALIFVEHPAVPQEYVVSNIANVQDRLDNITQQILSRTRLLRIIEKLDLYPTALRNNPDALVERMRKDIDIELVHSTDDRQVSAFNVYYSSKSPRLAQQVTEELLNLFITENIESRQQQSENTTEFLASQLEDARKSLVSQEERLRQYKDQYLGELPSQLQSNIQILAGLQSQLQAQQDALGQAKQQNAYLQSLLSQYRTVEASLSSGATNIPLTLPALDQELDRLRLQLADLSSHYTELHPDVQKLKQQIARTEHMKEVIAEDLSAKANVTKAEGNSNRDAVGLADVRDTSSPVVQVRSQLRSNQLEIANRDRSVKELEAKIGDYQGRLNRTPVHEQQLADITRDYDQSRADYDSLLAKKNQSEMATNLEKRQQGQTFRMIDPPGLPTKPYSPNRFKLDLGGLFAGLVLGAAFAVGAELTDDRIHRDTELRKLLPVEVIAEIPPVPSVPEARRARFATCAAWLTTFVVVMLVLAGTAYSYLKG